MREGKKCRSLRTASFAKFSCTKSKQLRTILDFIRLKSLGGIMEISGVFEDEYSSKVGSFTCPEDLTEWNGRTVKPLAGDESSSLSRVIRMRPMMSRPSRVDAEVIGGYSEDRGGYVEGKISASWGDSTPAPSSSDSSSKNEPSADVSK